VNGVSNPGRNVDLVAPTNQAIVIEPHDDLNQITIRETHSAARGDVHGLEASDLQALGAMLTSQYDLRRRVLRSVTFTQVDGVNEPAHRTIPVGFQPRLMLVLGECNALEPNGRPHRIGVSAFASGLDAQVCLAGDLSIHANSTDNIHPLRQGGICRITLSNNMVNPREAEVLEVNITDMTGPLGRELRTTLTRTGFTDTPRLSLRFTISLILLCMG
jgi:hypothetical protein